MKVLILGHGGHGKDLLASIIHHITGFSFRSSSAAACEKVIFPQMPEYSTKEECYADRRNRRDDWKRMISEYNTPDKARLVKEILAEHDMYVGLRCDLEYAASKHLFTDIFWVDASKRLPLEPTMKIEYDPTCMTLVDNNGSEDEFINTVIGLFYNRTRLLNPA